MAGDRTHAGEPGVFPLSPAHFPLTFPLYAGTGGTTMNLTADRHPRYLPTNASLSTVFWFYGVIPSNVLWAVFLGLLAWGVAAPVLVFAAAVLLVYTGWIVAAVWVAADGTSSRYGVVARWLTVAWTLNTVFALGFLVLDRVG